MANCTHLSENVQKRSFSLNFEYLPQKLGYFVFLTSKISKKKVLKMVMHFLLQNLKIR